MSNAEFFIIALILFATINILSALAFLLDKLSARENRYRIPESQLLMLAVLGGTIGCIAGQRLFRHKTQKQPFKSRLYTIGVLQIVFLLSLLIPDIRQAVFSVIRGH